ncbi:5-formyltetrahydrofolate cyclo-ligase [Arthrobacter sp. MYb224]|uniref:5-formyltetrahydrofolate cyclo-ligase n=1 Tax=Micrococcaceae TaxID=1268 RepID=UPI000CFB70C9|nr:5-formyltetrahydrofolate cyclo-ligase [Arthrobacter sp. MYb224]PQZ99365.1 5-formyltetrahydrofolate cyclo-ligase [Arthrobacter sp. MYb224]
MNAATSPPPGESKQARRAAVRAARRKITPNSSALLAEQLAARVLDYLDSSTGTVTRVGLYLSMPDEPDTSVLLPRLVQAGIEVYLPVCEPEYQLRWAHWTPEVQLVDSARAPVREPVGERHGARLFDTVHTLFIPALLVDEHGLRLGQGGGYYDRFLPQVADKATRIAALVYADEYVPAGHFPVDAHDRPVDLVITPELVHTIDP